MHSGICLKNLLTLVRALALGNLGGFALALLLYSCESGCRLLEPFLLGLAMDKVIHQQVFGIWPLLVLYVFYIAIGNLRRLYDTSFFSGLYTRLGESIAIHNLQNGSMSQTLARTHLAKDFVYTVEQDALLITKTAIAITGSLVGLYLYSWHILAIIASGLLVSLVCLIYLFPKINQAFGEQNSLAEVQLLRFESRDELIIQSYFHDYRRTHIAVGNLTTLSHIIFASINLAVIVLAFVLFVQANSVTIGAVFGLYEYCKKYFKGVNILPSLSQKVAKLQDISGRIEDSIQTPDLISM